MHFHPWRRLRLRPELEVRWRRLPEDVLGLTDGWTIWLDPRQPQRQKRCTLLHELIHTERGVACGTDEAEERIVEQITARHLIPLVALAEAIAWSQDEEQLADDLWTDVGVVRARLAGLTEAEKAYIEDRIAAIEATA